MKKQIHSIGAVLSACVLAFSAGSSSGDEMKPIKLAEADVKGGKPLMQALKQRASSREFAAKALPDQVLANLLWAASGVNRADSGKRTAPSAVNWQEIDVYVALTNGLFLYDARNHALNPVAPQDIRKHAGLQEFVAVAPAVLVYVADRARMKGAEDADKAFYSGVDTGFISQNVYLFCASEGLATVVLGMVNKPELHKVMNLRPDQEVILTQPVGYAVEAK